MDNREVAVEVMGLTKTFGPLKAVDDVSFKVYEGETFALLGPNGAGKTTLIRMLTTLLKPTGGDARVACCDVRREPAQVRRQIGVVPQAMTSDLDLTGYENMDLYGRFYNIPARERRERIRRLLDTVGLTSRAGDLVAAYSGGMRRRLEVARGLVHRPRILFLDEPTLGLDPQSRRVVWEFLRDQKEDDRMTIFLTTHYMQEAEEYSDRVGIIDAGKIIVMGSPSELKAALPGRDVVTLSLGEITGDIMERVKSLSFVHKVEAEDGRMRVYVDQGAQDLPGLIEEITAAGGKALSASVQEQTLEDVFIHYTGKSMREEEARKVSFLIGAGVPRKWSQR